MQAETRHASILFMTPPSRPRARTTIVFAVAAIASAAISSAQIVINETLHNPPGASPTEEHWEYIELYGRPGFALDGLALLVVSGGTDADRNGIPELAPHIDEAFALDGRRLGPDGCFTLYNSDARGRSELADRFWRGRAPTNAATFQQTALAPTGLVGRLANEGSITYLLVRLDGAQRAHLERITLDESPIDRDFDGVFDDPRLRSMQIIDALAWSHRGGREYAPTTDDELSETVGLNPDAVTRLAYQATAPEIGHRTRDRVNEAGRVSGYEVIPTSRADESFAYGVLDSGRFPEGVVYFDGFDFEGWPQFYTPTDPAALPFPLTSEDPEPDRKPFGPALRPSDQGVLMLRDMELSGLTLTPNAVNEHHSGVRQAVFVAGDADFDGRVTGADVAIAASLVGRGLSVSPLPQLHDAQTLLAVLSAEPVAGGVWERVVTPSCVDAVRELAEGE